MKPAEWAEARQSALSSTQSWMQPRLRPLGNTFVNYPTHADLVEEEDGELDAVHESAGEKEHIAQAGAAAEPAIVRSGNFLLNAKRGRSYPGYVPYELQEGASGAEENESHDMGESEVSRLSSSQAPVFIDDCAPSQPMPQPSMMGVPGADLGGMDLGGVDLGGDTFGDTYVPRFQDSTASLSMGMPPDLPGPPEPWMHHMQCGGNDAVVNFAPPAPPPYANPEVVPQSATMPPQQIPVQRGLPAPMCMPPNTMAMPGGTHTTPSMLHSEDMNYGSQLANNSRPSMLQSEDMNYGSQLGNNSRPSMLQSEDMNYGSQLANNSRPSMLQSEDMNYGSQLGNNSRPSMLQSEDMNYGSQLANNSRPSMLQSEDMNYGSQLASNSGSQAVPGLLREGVTTLMIRNLPLDMLQNDLIRELERCGLLDSCDFVYMPSSFGTRRGKGYAFVNFTNPDAAEVFFNTWHKSRRFGMAANVALNVSAAVVQGRDANVARWDSAKMRRVKNSNYRPYFPGATPTGGASGGMLADGFDARQTGGAYGAEASSAAVAAGQGVDQRFGQTAHSPMRAQPMQRGAQNEKGQKGSGRAGLVQQGGSPQGCGPVAQLGLLPSPPPSVPPLSTSPPGGSYGGMPDFVNADLSSQDVYEPQRTAAAYAPEIPAGQWVQLVGLVQAPDFNGRWGVVDAYDRVAQCYVVRVNLTSTSPSSTGQWTHTKLYRHNLMPQAYPLPPAQQAFTSPNYAI